MTLRLSDWVRPGDAIMWGQGPGAPLGLIATLLDQRAELGGVSAFCGLSTSTGISVEHTDWISFRSYGSQGDLRTLSRAGRLDVIPCHMSELPGLIRRGQIRCDVAFVALTPADADGWHSLGIAVQHLPAAIDSARVVLAEINDALPRARSPYRIHRSRLAASITVSRPVAELPTPAPGPRELAIAERVAELVADGSTIQTGVGALPGALLHALTPRRKLKVHTGLITDTLLDLIDAGAMTQDSTPATITGAAFGSRRLYERLTCLDVEIHSTEHTHDLDVVEHLERFVSINSALEVDLLGQVSSEVANGRYVGGLGGQADFARAAARSPDGRSVIALPSVTGRGASRIVARVGAPVTLARSDVDCVVTEHGVASLRGLTDGERAEAIVAIADPAFRNDLRDHWRTHRATGVDPA